MSRENHTNNAVAVMLGAITLITPAPNELAALSLTVLATIIFIRGLWSGGQVPEKRELQPGETDCRMASYNRAGIIWKVWYKLSSGYWGIEGTCPKDGGRIEVDDGTDISACTVCGDTFLPGKQYNKVKKTVKGMSTHDWRSKWGRMTFQPAEGECIPAP